MKKITIGDACKLIRTGKTPPSKEKRFFEGKLNWYNPSDIGKSKILGSSARFISYAAITEKKATMFPANSLLVTCIGDIGRVGIINSSASSNQQITCLSPKSFLDTSFLYYWFIKNKSLLEHFSNTAVVPILNSTSLSKLQIPLPPLPIQQKIAEALDKADAIRKRNQQILGKYDQLAQSVFLEMFGDTYLNPKKWAHNQLCDVVKPGKIITYGIVQAGPNVEDGVPYIRTGDLVDGKILEKQLLKTSIQIAESYKRSRCSYGDIIMSIRATVGTAAILPKSLNGANLTQGTARISPDNSKVNTFYLFHAIISKGVQTKIQKFTKGATFREITLTKLREVEIPVPPLHLQNKFAQVIEHLENQKQKQQIEINKSEELFQSLLQRAFNGELFSEKKVNQQLEMFS